MKTTSLVASIFNLIFLISGPSWAEGAYCSAQEDKNLNQLAQIACQTSANSPSCQSFFAQFENSSRAYLQNSDCLKNSNEKLQASVTCSPVILAAGASAIQKGAPGALKAMPNVAKALLPKVVGFASVLAVPMTIHSIGSMTMEALDKDKSCFEDINFKRNSLQLMKAESDSVNKAFGSMMNDFQKSQVQFSERYLYDAFIRDITCQQLKDLMLQQKRKIDQVIGPILAKNKSFEDPRKKAVTSNGFTKANLLLSENIECLSATKKIEALCHIGNLALSASALRSGFSDLKLKPSKNSENIISQKRTPTSNSPPTINFTDNKPSFNAETMEQINWKTLSAKEIEKDYPGWAGKNVIIHPDYVSKRVVRKEAFIRYEKSPADDLVDEEYLKIDMLKGHPEEKGVGEYLKKRMIAENPGVPIYSTLAHRNGLEFKKSFLQISENPNLIKDPQKTVEILANIPALRSSRGTMTLKPIYNSKGDLEDMGVLLRPDSKTNSLQIENLDALLKDEKFKSWIKSLKDRPSEYWGDRLPRLNPDSTD